jgi:hypothetical protein
VDNIAEINASREAASAKKGDSFGRRSLFKNPIDPARRSRTGAENGAKYKAKVSPLEANDCDEGCVPDHDG